MENFESKPSNLPENFAQKLAMLKKKKEARAKDLDEKYNDPFEDEWLITQSQLLHLAEGNDDEGIGKKYYPGWKPEHFKILLEELEKLD